MNLAVVKMIIHDDNGYMSWEDCVAHNRKHYGGEIFLMSKFDQETAGDSIDVLMDKGGKSPFLCEKFLEIDADTWRKPTPWSWDQMVCHWSKATLFDRAQKIDNSDQGMLVRYHFGVS